MRINPTRLKKRIGKHEWFAWRPVWIRGNIVWLETITRDWWWNRPDPEWIYEFKETA